MGMYSYYVKMIDPVHFEYDCRELLYLQIHSRRLLDFIIIA